MNQLFKKAFTLIELLVVIAIIGILSGLIVVSMSGVTKKATIAKAQVFSNSLRNALMLNLVSEWKFEEGSGTVANDTWKGTANGTITGATYSATASCLYGGCLAFSGTGQYVTVSHAVVPVFTTKLTVMSWVKGVAQANGTVISQWDDNGKRSWIMNSSNGLLRVGLSSDGGATNYKSYVTSSVIGFDNDWHFIGFSYDTGTLSLYVDGVVADVTLVADGTCNSLFDSDANLTIGCALSSGSETNLFVGNIDDTRLYNDSVPTSQIKEMYYSGLNNLLANGSIGIDEYKDRMGELAIKP
ncbi:MAG: LamG-like jellyroll fold domain-containing protein [Minisyncoccales bacterium]